MEQFEKSLILDVTFAGFSPLEESSVEDEYTRNSLFSGEHENYVVSFWCKDRKQAMLMPEGQTSAQDLYGTMWIGQYGATMRAHITDRDNGQNGNPLKMPLWQDLDWKVGYIKWGAHSIMIFPETTCHGYRVILRVHPQAWQTIDDIWRIMEKAARSIRAKRRADTMQGGLQWRATESAIPLRPTDAQWRQINLERCMGLR